MAMREARMLYLHALTPVHSGTGQTAGIIDLPIAREKATGWPLLPGSSLKGVLRDALTPAGGGEWVDRTFGKPDAAGDLCFGDQRILCLAVRSFYGTYACVTSPLVLNRLVRDLRLMSLPLPFASGLPEVPEGRAMVAAPSAVAEAGKVFLEDLDFDAAANATGTAIAAGLAAQLFEEADEQRLFRERLAIVSNDAFSFLCETATEVTARVRLAADTKTVEAGGLWYEEAVPAESLFAGPLLFARSPAPQARDALASLSGTLLQLGGDASVGRGLCRLLMKA